MKKSLVNVDSVFLIRRGGESGQLAKEPAGSVTVHL